MAKLVRRLSQLTEHPKQVSLAVFCGLSLALFASWYFVESHFKQDIRSITQAHSDALAQRLELFVDYHIRALQRQSLVWLDGPPNDANTYATNTRPIIELLPSFQAVNWVNLAKRIQFVAPLQGNLPALGADLSEHPIASPLIDSVIADNQLRATNALSLLQGGTGVAVYQPVTDRDGSLIGFLNGVFRTTSLISDILPLPAERWYHVSVRDSQSLLFSDGARDASNAYSVSSELKVADKTWYLSLTPNDLWLEQNLSNKARLLLLFGLPLSALISLLVHASLTTLGNRKQVLEHRKLFDGNGELVLARADGGMLTMSSDARSILNLPPQQQKSMSFWDFLPEYFPNGRNAQERISELLSNPGEWHSCGPEEVALVSMDQQVTICTLTVAAFDQDTLTLHLHQVYHDPSISKRLQTLTTQDPMSGLPNRAVGIDRLRQSVSHARRKDSQACAMIIEFEPEQSHQDRMARQLGTGEDGLLLRCLIGRIRGCLREADTLARLEGTRFLVVAESVEGSHGASRMALRLYNAFTTPLDYGGTALVGSLSIGIAMYPVDSRSAEQMVSYAHNAQQRAKLAKNLTICFFSRSLSEQLKRDFELAERLRTAINTNSLDLVLLPRRALASGEITGYAVQVVWLTGDGAHMDHEQVMDLAERTGLKTDLTAWMLRTVADQRSHDPDWAGANHPLSIQLGAAQFMDRAIFDVLANRPLHSDVMDRDIEIDLEEADLVELGDTGFARLSQFSTAELRVNLTGFFKETGLAAHLVRYPFRRVHFPVSFVEAARQDSSIAKLLEGACKLALSLDLIPVADGDSKQVDSAFLEECGFLERQSKQVAEVTSISPDSTSFPN